MHLHVISIRGRIQDLGLGGHVERRRRTNRGAADAEGRLYGVKYGEGCMSIGTGGLPFLQIFSFLGLEMREIMREIIRLI